MKPIFLNDLLNFEEKDFDNKIKVKFNIRNEDNEEPKDIYQKNPDEINNGWLFWRNKKRNFLLVKLQFVLLIYGMIDGC